MSTYYHNLREKTARRLHIRPPQSSDEQLLAQLRAVKQQIQGATPEEIEFAKYIAASHENTDKEFENLVNKHNKGGKPWGHISSPEAKQFINEVLTKENKNRYKLDRPHLLESSLKYKLGLPSEMARTSIKSSYPSYHAAWSSYLAEHAKRNIPKSNRHEADDLVNRIVKSRHILGYHTPQDTTEGTRIGKAYARKQLR